MIDWTAVLVVGIPAYIAAGGAAAAAVYSAKNRRELRTPNGTSVGQLVEHTHDLAAETVETVHKINGDVPNG